MRKEDEVLDLVMDYEISMPFPVLGLSSLHRTIRCRRRCWTGVRADMGSVIRTAEKMSRLSISERTVRGITGPELPLSFKSSDSCVVGAYGREA